MIGVLGPTVVYALCLVASVICAGLLIQTWLRTRSKLLFWTALGFGLLAVNNLLLFADMVIFPMVDLWPYRQAALALAIGVFFYGFVWEIER